jgi:hypothetical protein
MPAKDKLEVFNEIVLLACLFLLLPFTRVPEHQPYKYLIVVDVISYIFITLVILAAFINITFQSIIYFRPGYFLIKKNTC